MQSWGVISLQDLMRGSDKGALKSTYSMPKMFTRAIHDKEILALIQDLAANAGKGDWVIEEGEGASPSRGDQNKWVNELRQMYAREYAQQWMSWLKGLQIKEFHSLDEAAAKLKFLAQAEGPLTAGLKTVRIRTVAEPELEPLHQALKKLQTRKA